MKASMIDRMGIGALIVTIGIVIANIVAWFTALITDIASNEVVWAILDFVFAPIGVIRGWLMWFGVI